MSLWVAIDPARTTASCGPTMSTSAATSGTRGNQRARLSPTSMSEAASQPRYEPRRNVAARLPKNTASAPRSNQVLRSSPLANSVIASAATVRAVRTLPDVMALANTPVSGWSNRPAACWSANFTRPMRLVTSPPTNTAVVSRRARPGSRRRSATTNTITIEYSLRAFHRLASTTPDVRLDRIHAPASASVAHASGRTPGACGRVHGRESSHATSVSPSAISVAAMDSGSANANNTSRRSVAASAFMRGPSARRAPGDRATRWPPPGAPARTTPRAPGRPACAPPPRRGRRGHS